MVKALKYCFKISVCFLRWPKVHCYKSLDSSSFSYSRVGGTVGAELYQPVSLKILLEFVLGF